MMKKLSFLLVLMAFASMAFAQVQTISYPEVQGTITPEQIKALGEASQQNANREVIVLNFEGMGNSDPINNFYNGGTSGQGYSGPNYGIQFGVALALIDADIPGGSGNFANEPSPSTIMFFLDANAAFMNVPAGFTTGFAFYYASLNAGTVSVYNGLNGTGTLLNSVNLPSTNPGAVGGDPTGYYDGWYPISVPFTGTARSVVFGGDANYIGFDDVTFGSVTPGGDEVPISNWALFIGIGLILIAAVVRFRRLI